VAEVEADSASVLRRQLAATAAGGGDRRGGQFTPAAGVGNLGGSRRWGSFCGLSGPTQITESFSETIPHSNCCKKVPNRPLRERTVAKESQIGLCGSVEADLELFCNCWRASILGKRLERERRPAQIGSCPGQRLGAVKGRRPFQARAGVSNLWGSGKALRNHLHA